MAFFCSLKGSKTTFLKQCTFFNKGIEVTVMFLAYIDDKDIKIVETRMDELEKPLVAVSQIEARYALQPMGRDLELMQLLGDELPHLAEKYSQEFPGESPSMTHHLFKQGSNYITKVLVQRHGFHDEFSIFLNLSASAFLIHAQGKNYSLITAKGVVQVLEKILFGPHSPLAASPHPSPTSVALG
jgi:hypothetical protein